MLFIYIISGWEGSATDAWVWADALAKDFLCWKYFIILQMPDILTARNFLFLFVVFGIIFRSGMLQVFGMYFLFLMDLIFLKIIQQPNKCKETIQPSSCSGMQCHWAHFWGSQATLQDFTSSLSPWLSISYSHCSMCSPNFHSKNQPQWRYNTYRSIPISSHTLAF